MGSGTTLVAARQCERDAYGVDRDHLALRIAKCATSSYDTNELVKLNSRVLDRAKKIQRVEVVFIAKGTSEAFTR